MTTTPLPRALPCRYCGYPAWLEDHDGPLHTCCQYWAAELTAGRGCPACIASRMSRTRRFPYTVIDRRAIASGKRRSSLTAYRQAQAAEAAARMADKDGGDRGPALGQA